MVRLNGILVKCPQCASDRVWKDGLRRNGRKTIQRFLCRQCSFRFSESTQANVKLNVSGQLLEVSKPGEDDVEASIPEADPPVKSPPDANSLLLGENIRSHRSSSNVSTIESLKDFRLHSNNRRVCVPEGGMINLAEVKPQQEEAVAGAKQKQTEAEAKILEHAWRLKKEGYKESTICKSCLLYTSDAADE